MNQQRTNGLSFEAVDVCALCAKGKTGFLKVEGDARGKRRMFVCSYKLLLPFKLFYFKILKRFHVALSFKSLRVAGVNRKNF